MNIKKILLSAAALFSAAGVLISSMLGSQKPSDTQAPNSVASSLEVHFIDVGQGDSTLILCGDEAMLIDAGENDKGTLVQDYLTAQGVKSLKYMIGTHPDSDHIGGMDVILYKFDCETVIMPDEAKNTATYRDVIDVMKNKRYTNTLPEIGASYQLGDAEFTILSPAHNYDNSNNNSVVILLTHGENRFLFSGDAQEPAEEDILNCGISLKADVYKAGHHGSSTSSSEDFLNAISPTYAVISCGEDNSYGHPHAEVLNSFRMMGVQVFRTDEQGSILAKSDGKTITWNCSPTESWLSGNGTHVADVPDPDAVNTYVCNSNTKKFHYPDCPSAKDMKEENRVEIKATRAEMIKQGYEPCKGCKP